MSASETRKAMQAYLNNCEQFLYSYKPNLTVRYVFRDKTVNGLVAAFEYAKSLESDDSNDE